MVLAVNIEKHVPWGKIMSKTNFPPWICGTITMKNTFCYSIAQHKSWNQHNRNEVLFNYKYLIGGVWRPLHSGNPHKQRRVLERSGDENTFNKTTMWWLFNPTWPSLFWCTKDLRGDMYANMWPGAPPRPNRVNKASPFSETFHSGIEHLEICKTSKRWLLEQDCQLPWYPASCSHFGQCQVPGDYSPSHLHFCWSESTTRWKALSKL